MKKTILMILCLLPLSVFAQYGNYGNDTNYVLVIILTAFLSLAISIAVVYIGTKEALKKTNKILTAIALKLETPLGDFMTEDELSELIIRHPIKYGLNGDPSHDNKAYDELKNKLRGWHDLKSGYKKINIDNILCTWIRTSDRQEWEFDGGILSIGGNKTDYKILNSTEEDNHFILKISEKKYPIIRLTEKELILQIDFFTQDRFLKKLN